MEALDRRLLSLGLALLLVAGPLLGQVAAGDGDGDGMPELAEVGGEHGVTERELPLLSEPLPRGSVTWLEDQATTGATTPKTVDGEVSDWVATPTRLGGTTILEAGELVHQDTVFDDFGADDGKDVARNRALAPAYQAEPGTTRVETVTQAAGEQFGADDVDPTQGYLTGPANYGDAAYPQGTGGQADLLEARVAIQDDQAVLLVRTVALVHAQDLAVLLLVETDRSDGEAHHGPVPFNSGLTTNRATLAYLLTSDGVTVADLEASTQAPQPAAQVAVQAAGATNALEASLPLDDPVEWGPRPQVAIATGIHDGAGALSDVATGQAEANVLNAAFREEPTVSNWMEKQQATVLYEGTLDPFFHEVDTAALLAGTTVPWQPTPGYHEAIFRSDPAISEETLVQGPKETRVQHYGLYLPTAWTPEVELPLTTWLHWRGGTAHQAPAWTPRAVDQLGEGIDAILISPRGRGTSTWYLGAGHVDVLEAMDDVQERFQVDEDRRYVTGYSMGGFGSYLYGLLYPDLFAAAYPISGALTQGAWFGIDEGGTDTITDEGEEARPNDLLTYRLLENARNLPYVIHHGTDDELVPITGVQRVGVRLAELGYRYRLYTFPGYEHFSQALVDEWAEGARFLQAHERDRTPDRVVYKRVPALEDAVESLETRGAEIALDVGHAYWLSGMTVREPTPEDPTSFALADVTSLALVDDHVLARPEAGVLAPGHSTPYVMHGQAWVPPGCILLPGHALPGCPDPTPIQNQVNATLTNVASATLDHQGMSITPQEVFRIEAETDGDTTLTITGDWSNTVVTDRGGQDTLVHPTADGLVLELLGGGDHMIEVAPSG